MAEISNSTENCIIELAKCLLLHGRRRSVLESGEMLTTAGSLYAKAIDRRIRLFFTQVYKEGEEENEDETYWRIVLDAGRRWSLDFILHEDTFVSDPVKRAYSEYRHLHEYYEEVYADMYSSLFNDDNISNICFDGSIDKMVSDSIVTKMAF